MFYLAGWMSFAVAGVISLILYINSTFIQIRFVYGREAALVLCAFYGALFGCIYLFLSQIG